MKSLGKKSEGLRLERIKASPLWSGEAFRNIHPILPRLLNSGVPSPTVTEFICGGERRVPQGHLPSIDPTAAWAKKSTADPNGTIDPGGVAYTKLTTTSGIPMDKPPFTVEVAQEFHRRMAAIIVAVQTGIWEAGLHNLLGYATDYAPGQERGLQTLILKTRNRSAYVRLQWDAVLGDAPADRQHVDAAISSAINELA